MTRNRILKLLVFFILFLALLLRVWKLGSIPPHLTPDEAALGYNAYSILKTGRDEHGTLLPIIFKSFGDWKPGLYIYLTVPFVAILGLTDFAVRLPSALAGVVAVWLVYQLVLELGRLSGLGGLGRDESRINNYGLLASIAAFMLAISPWHIHFSRGAWEANVSLTLTLAGIYFFLKSLVNSRFLILASLLFSSTLLMYQGAKLSSLIVVILLVFVYRRRLLALARSDLVSSLVIGIIVSLPIILSTISGKTGRLKVFSVFSYPRPVEYTQAFIGQAGVQKGSFSYNLFYSEPLNFFRGIAGRWFNHFSAQFLFFEGDYQNPKHSAPNHGVLLLADLLFLPLGLLGIFREKFSKEKRFFLLWLIFAPLPAVLSRDQVQAVRAYNMVIPLALISAFGVCFVVGSLQKIRLSFKCTVYGLLLLTSFGSIVYYLDAYFVHLPVHDANYWHYGYKQAVYKITRIQNQHKRILFQQSYDQPYIYFLFFQKYDPRAYQSQVNLVEGGVDVGLVEKLDNIHFESFSWPAPSLRGDLVVGDAVATLGSTDDKSFRLISEIRYPNGLVAFRILEKL